MSEQAGKTRRGSRTVRRKLEVRSYLEKQDYDSILEWANVKKHAGSTLLSLLFDPDEAFRWRTIQALGLVCKQQADRDLEVVREVIRRLYWQMNDESGGLIWKAPEALGEIMYHLPDLMNEYASMLLSNANMEPFQRGVHWAAARMSSKSPEKFMMAAEHFRPSLENEDPYIRAFTHVFLINAQAPATPPELEAAKADKSTFEVYNFETGELVESTVGAVVAEALNK